MSAGRRVLVTGATGLLGPYLAAAIGTRDLAATFVGLSSVPEGRPDWVTCDLAVARDVEALWHQVQPELVVHAAALTSVDLCESNPGLADAVNRGTTAALASLAAGSDARIVFVSTDSVFDGTRGGYAEDDTTAPLNVYARSKLAAEEALVAATDHLAVRTNFFGRSPRGHGLVEWLLRELDSGRPIVGFADVVFSPLHCGALAELLLDLALGGTRGILHLGSAEPTTKLDFAQRIARAYGLDVGLISAGRLDDVALRAPRPRDTSLHCARAAAILGRSLPSVQEGIDAMRAGDDPG